MLLTVQLKARPAAGLSQRWVLNFLAPDNNEQGFRIDLLTPIPCQCPLDTCMMNPKIQTSGQKHTESATDKPVQQ